MHSSRLVGNSKKPSTLMPYSAASTLVTQTWWFSKKSSIQTKMEAEPYRANWESTTSREDPQLNNGMTQWNLQHQTSSRRRMLSSSRSTLKTSMKSPLSTHMTLSSLKDLESPELAPKPNSVFAWKMVEIQKVWWTLTSMGRIFLRLPTKRFSIWTLYTHHFLSSSIHRLETTREWYARNYKIK